MTTRRKRILYFSLLLGFSACVTVHVVSTAWSHRGPRIEIANQVVDLGIIDGMDPNVPERVFFRIRNGGSGVLKLTRLLIRCRCIEPRIDNDVLNPGEETKVSVGFQAPRKVGEFRETISLSSNDPHNPVMKLVIKGLVHRYCQVLPESVVVDDLRLGEERRVELEVMGPVGDGEFAVLDARADKKGIHLETIKKTGIVTELARSVWTVALIVTGRGERAWEGTILLSTSSGTIPSVDVPVTVRELPPVSASPAIAILRPHADGVTATVELEVTANTPVPVKVKDIAKPDWLDLSVEPDANNLPVRLCLTAKTTSSTLSMTLGNEIVLTLQGELPEVKIPVLLLPAADTSLSTENRSRDNL